MKVKQMLKDDLAMLPKLQSDMDDQLSKVRQTIQENINFLKSNDGTEIMKYKSKLNKFNRIPPSFDLSLPTFSPLKIQGEQLVQMFGKLQPSSKIEIPGFTIHRSEESFLPYKQFLDKIIVNKIKAGSEINGVCCVPNTGQYITCSCELMKRLDRKGTVYETVRVKAQNYFGLNVTATTKGNLVYSDYDDRSVKLVHQGNINTIIRLRGWHPLAVCSTSSNDLLVSMRTDNERQSKVIRYSGSTVTQEIQFDDENEPLYSLPQFIAENKNLQVCVSDTKFVVVTDRKGKLMFRYDGDCSSNKYTYNTCEPLGPCGLAIDSMCHILVAYYHSGCVHIINHVGKFLRYINFETVYPCDVSISTDDMLYIADGTSEVRVIKYLQ